MIRLLLTKLFQLLLLFTALSASFAATYPATVTPESTLKILSSTDESVMKILITDFQQLHPQVTVEYLDRNTLPLFERFLANYEKGETADLIISSAMDLQIKLVNDGYAANHSMQSLSWLPDWAQWRQQAFGFTYEPAVIVYNKQKLQGKDVPQSRFELIDKLRDQPRFFSQRVGTYDITRSGFGYLIASQDAQQASTWGRLTENLNNVKVKLYDSTSDMLDAVQSGKLLLSYNVLGSYAFAATERFDNLGIILPSDYTLVMSRVAFISKRAKNPEEGHRFLDYLLSERANNYSPTRQDFTRYIPMPKVAQLTQVYNKLHKVVAH